MFLCIDPGVCNHAFHFHCISRWLKTRQVCPLGIPSYSLSLYFSLYRYNILHTRVYGWGIFTEPKFLQELKRIRQVDLFMCVWCVCKDVFILKISGDWWCMSRSCGFSLSSPKYFIIFFFSLLAKYISENCKMTTYGNYSKVNYWKQ